LDSPLPRSAEITIYARIGDLLFIIAVVGTTIVSLLVRLKR
jgi:hypothetical protein